MNIVKRIEKWQKDRLLDKQEYNYANEFVNILEELMESIGIEVPKEKRTLIMQDFIEFIFKTERKYELKKKRPTEEEEVDSYADIIVLSIGAILKLGYDPVCVLEECLKEIESRTGKIVNGKFQKDTSPEARAKWYKADYKKCKRRD